MMPPRSPFAAAHIIGCFLFSALAAAQAPNPHQLDAAPPPSASPEMLQDYASKIISDAQNSFARVRDYSGLFYRQERVKGELMPEQSMQIRVRQQPFSVHMKWLGPQKLVGQEAYYVASKNNNQVKVKAAGALMSALGFMSFDPNDPKIMATNRHPITEAGIGNLIERLAQGNETERRLPSDHCELAFADYKFLGRPVTRMESTHRKNNGQFYCYRTVVYLDKETRLPVRFEAYDWPRQGGSPAGDILECYSFVDVKFNIGLTDSAFSH